MPPFIDDSVDFRQKYRNLKKKFKLLIYENECFQEELRKAQRKLLKVSRDKSFLLDRLLQYESVDSTSSDSDATESSDSDSEQKHELPPLKKKKLNSTHTEPVSIAETITTAPPMKPVEVAPKKKKPPRKTLSKTSVTTSNTTTVTTITAPIATPTISTVTTPVVQPTPTPPIPAPTPAPTPTLPPLGDGHMTSEEIERHLEAKQALRDLLPEKAPLTVPAEMFSTEPSNLDSDLNDSVQGLDSPPGRGGIDDDLAMSLPDKYDV